MKEEEIIETEEVKEVEQNDSEVEEIAKEKGSFITKTKTRFKKYGKKIVTLAAIGAAGFIGYCIGHKNDNSEAYTYSEESNFTAIDSKEDEKTEN